MGQNSTELEVALNFTECGLHCIRSKVHLEFTEYYYRTRGTWAGKSINIATSGRLGRTRRSSRLPGAAKVPSANPLIGIMIVRAVHVRMLGSWLWHEQQTLIFLKVCCARGLRTRM